ncbi:hypothetical protein L1887_25685 [Cichorium endivia]|nr:hypothetical protein L1887_25685 [Cichorium endivia]
MRDSSLDLFDPRTAVMDSFDYTIEVGRGGGDFGFAFNDSNFSDRILRIEIISESTAATPNGRRITLYCQEFDDQFMKLGFLMLYGIKTVCNGTQGPAENNPKTVKNHHG